jgi:peptidoglycan hydrolase-like protein with peptidoglycan-binding domain
VINQLLGKPRTGTLVLRCALALSCLAMTGCPHNVDVKLDETLPEVKTTTFTDAVSELGLMSEIYGDKKVRIMPKDILDNTGTSIATNAEVPRDITEMIKSTLNAVGGNVIFVPYDPAFMLNLYKVGFTDWGDKLVPTIVVSGGITEFDRGLETHGKNTDLSLEGEINHINLGWEYSTLDKNSLASITLDFNVIDFLTNAGIPRVQAVNTIKVHKALAEDSLGFTIQGNTLGLKGTVKKIQGRHAAVRLLVQLSMVQLIGKYLALPYWKLLPDGKPDSLVLDKLSARFFDMDDTRKIAKTQEYLAMYGYPVQINGVLDDTTQSALRDFRSKHPDASGNVDQATFLALFSHLPVSREVLARRRSALASASLQPASAPLAQAKAAPPQQAQAAPPKAAESANLQFLALKTNQTEYAIGDPLTISFAVNAPMYIRLYNVSSTGEITQLLPGSAKSDQPVRPGQSYQVPSAGYSWDISGPAGTDKILALGSAQPFPRDAALVTRAGDFTREAQERYSARAALAIRIR